MHKPKCPQGPRNFFSNRSQSIRASCSPRNKGKDSRTNPRKQTNFELPGFFAIKSRKNSMQLNNRILVTIVNGKINHEAQMARSCSACMFDWLKLPQNWFSQQVKGKKLNEYFIVIYIINSFPDRTHWWKSSDFFSANVLTMLFLCYIFWSLCATRISQREK